MMELKKTIEDTWNKRELLKSKKSIDCINTVIEEIDKGRLRIAEKIDDKWQVNNWLKKAVILYFPIRKMETIEIGPLEFHDKMKLKNDYANLGVRVVPHAIARYGSYLSKGVIMMPSYVNIGAYVDSGTMIDTISGGVGIGGVLEPVQASPVIIEDDAFLGSRSIIVEGVKIEKEAVLGANVVLTSSTKIIDVSGEKPIEHQGIIPSRSVVIPGSYEKEFQAGKFGVPCALIIGKRKESTDKKTTLNDALRDYKVSI